jgi:tetratricopeptide (TPR) repeat protein
MLMACWLWKIIAWENDLSTYEEKSVAVAFGIQLEELERRSSDFSNLLKVLSFLDPERISLDMIVEGGEELRSASYPISAGTTPLDSLSREGDTTAVSPTFKSVIALICSPVQLQQAIQQFQRLSLVGYASNTDGSSLRIHDLIQTTIQEGARRQDARHHSFHIAARLVCGAFRHVDDPASHKCWSQCEMFSPHIQSLTKWGDEYAAQMSELDEANIGIAQYLNSCGRYSEAEKLFGRVLAGKERRFGPEHPDTLAIVKSLAVVYGEQGRYDEAEVLFKRALAGQEKLLGSEHLTTLLTAEGLGVIYRRQKRYDEAEVLYGRSLAAKKNLFDPHHPDTLQTGDALGCVYHRQGRYAEAELLHSEALASREMLLGLDHPETLKTIHNLAIVLSSQGRCNEAEALWARALVGREKHLGQNTQTLCEQLQSLQILTLFWADMMRQRHDTCKHSRGERRSLGLSTHILWIPCETLLDFTSSKVDKRT